MDAIARPGAKSSPNLDAMVRTYRAQLADWVSCPSAKTPEGKAKIEQIHAKLDAVQHEIKASSGDSPSAIAPAQSEASQRTEAACDYLNAQPRVGTVLSIYA